MKAAVVLNADSPSLFQQAGEIDRLREGLELRDGAELWLFKGARQPRMIPDLAGGLREIELIRVENAPAAESYLGLLEQMAKRKSVRLFLFGNDDLGSELAPRLAYRLGGSCCLQAESCRATENGLRVGRPAYNHNMAAEFDLTRAPFCLSPARSGGPPAPATALRPGTTETEGLIQPQTPWLHEAETTPAPGQSALDRASTVLAVGLGAAGPENLGRLDRIAGALGAELGVSRPVAMNGWAPMERFIGASGKVLAPSLCLAAGVSGSAVFGYGIQNSDFIVAVNTDPEAPIFDLADVGVVDDMMEVLTELAKLAESNGNEAGNE